jgi:hypothetical protein
MVGGLTGSDFGALYTRIVYTGESVHLGEMGAESGVLLPPLSVPFAPYVTQGSLIPNPFPSHRAKLGQTLNFVSWPIFPSPLFPVAFI